MIDKFEKLKNINKNRNPEIIKENKNKELLQIEFDKYTLPEFQKTESNFQKRKAFDFS